ncbi:Hypothetical protein A7982_03004 [Minicystis rosea]|nr:Hypothetical protein A7982_03004 [Minicystis rosea]
MGPGRDSLAICQFPRQPDTSGDHGKMSHSRGLPRGARERSARFVKRRVPFGPCRWRCLRRSQALAPHLSCGDRRAGPVPSFAEKRNVSPESLPSYFAPWRGWARVPPDDYCRLRRLSRPGDTLLPRVFLRGGAGDPRLPPRAGHHSALEARGAQWVSLCAPRSPRGRAGRLPRRQGDRDCPQEHLGRRR